MTIRQKMRKQRKKQIKKEYKHVKWLMEMMLQNTKEEHMELKSFPKEDIIAVYLVAIYLEKKGFRCYIDDKRFDVLSDRLVLKVNW